MTELYVKGDPIHSGDWDDRELIKAYDRAMSQTKEKVRAKLQTQSNKYEKHKNELNIELGAPCRAVYDEDNIEYEATIQDLINDDKVLINFVGYGNFQEVLISDLKPSLGVEARFEQDREANEVKSAERLAKHVLNEEKIKANSKKPQSNVGIMDDIPFPVPPPPPVPPQLSRSLKSNVEHQALNSMLMAWYMSGYHTGYYHGLKDSKK